MPGQDRCTHGRWIGDVGGAGIGAAQQAPVAQVAEANGLDRDLTVVAHVLRVADLSGCGEVGAADHAIAQIFLDAARFIHARQDGPHHRLHRQLALLLRQGALGEQVEFEQRLHQLHLGAAGVNADRFDLGEGAMQRQQLLLVEGVLAGGLDFARKMVLAGGAEGVEHLDAPIAEQPGPLRQLLESHQRRPGKHDLIGVDVFQEIEIHALDLQVAAAGTA